MFLPRFYNRGSETYQRLLSSRLGVAGSIMAHSLIAGLLKLCLVRNAKFQRQRNFAKESELQNSSRCAYKEWIEDTCKCFFLLK